MSMKFVPDEDLGEWRVFANTAVRLTRTEHRDEVWRSYRVELRDGAGSIHVISEERDRKEAGPIYHTTCSVLRALFKETR